MGSLPSLGFKLYMAAIVLLVDAFFLWDAQCAIRRRLFIKRTPSLLQECNESVTIFETNLASVTCCMATCLNDRNCTEISYHDDNRNCQGFHQENSSTPCVVQDSVKTYITGTGFTYLGCFRDADPRTIPYVMANNDMSIDLCYARCMMPTQENIYFSLQNSHACYCGNAATNYSKYGKAGEDECNMACLGNKGQTCGAGWRNSAYRIFY